MKPVNFSGIIENAEKRRAAIQAVTDLYPDVAYHLDMLLKVQAFAQKLGTLHADIDKEGKDYLLSALNAGTSFGTAKLNQAFFILVGIQAEKFTAITDSLRLLADAVDVKGA